MRSSVDFWYLRISRRATVPGRYLWGFLTPPVAGADFLAALVASCFLGALPPVDLRAVCLVRAICIDCFGAWREESAINRCNGLKVPVDTCSTSPLTPGRYLRLVSRCTTTKHIHIQCQDAAREERDSEREELSAIARSSGTTSRESPRSVASPLTRLPSLPNASSWPHQLTPSSL